MPESLSSSAAAINPRTPSGAAYFSPAWVGRYPITWGSPCEVSAIGRRAFPLSLIILSSGPSHREEAGAAVHEQHLAAHEARRVAAKKHDGVGDLVGRRIPLQGDLLVVHPLGIGRARRHKPRRLGRAGTDAVHAHAFGPHLAGQAARIMHDSRLGDGVGDSLRDADIRGDRAKGDYCALSAL